MGYYYIIKYLLTLCKMNTAKTTVIVMSFVRKVKQAYQQKRKTKRARIYRFSEEDLEAFQTKLGELNDLHKSQDGQKRTERSFSQRFQELEMSWNLLKAELDHFP